MMSKRTKPREPWFAVGKPLSGYQAAIPMALSFVIPILIWCFAAYAPFLWHVDYRITMTSEPSDKEAFPATYVVDDTMEESFFESFQDSIRQDNKTLKEQREAGTVEVASARAGRRANQKVLKNFEPVMRANGWFTTEKTEENVSAYFKAYFAATYETWGKLAAGELKPASGTLSRENLAIVKDNWALLSSVSPTYDSGNFLSEPIYRLIPEGKKVVGRPAYLPAPHEVVVRGWQDFRGESELGELNVWEKYASSLRVVISGFLLCVLIGIPLALLAGTFSFFARLFEPFTDFFRYMPAPAFGTVLMAIFGVDQQPKIALVFLGTFPQLILMVANTTRLLEQPMLDAAQTLGARKGQLVWRVVVPGILPSLYNDLRILLGWAWTWLVVAELIGTKSGLTEIIDTQGRRFHFDHVYPIILLVGLTGFLTDQVLANLRDIFFPWATEGKKSPLARLFRWVGSRVQAWRDVDPPVAPVTVEASTEGESHP
ncbi:ABC transporter permease [Roseibacillus persicicus]|nr:ABC transporter permease [Roseibacillus persicicus]